ncbi:Mitochondrial import inner membrane translocase subunit Tim9 [Platanthera guangdongensis]|uniref:Mitochondrial import inner membrane translocase subunit n=1 Tax=Platanthera guangdongensis TaxID=2320717 RepID=A0ABR2LI69_9ASPA
MACIFFQEKKSIQPTLLTMCSHDLFDSRFHSFVTLQEELFGAGNVQYHTSFSEPRLSSGKKPIMDRLPSSVSGKKPISALERCFDDCVDSFRRKTLDKQEETCVRKCAEKFLKHSMRVGMRLAELNQGAASQD